MINADDPDHTYTFDILGTRVYCVDGRDGPLALYHPLDDSQWIGSECPLDVREWR